MELAILGCGQMGGAILRGILESCVHEAAEVIIFHPNAQRAAILAAEFGVKATSCLEDLRQVDRILLAVKPQLLERVLSELREFLSSDQLLLSVVAGWTVAKIETVLARQDLQVVRAMPNTPVQICKGVIPWSANSLLSEQNREYVDCIFSALGHAEEVAAELMDPLTALCGCAPAYMFTVIEALADAAVYSGIPRAQAEKLAALTMEGAAKLASSSALSAADLRAQVTSPKGATAAGSAELERHAIRAAWQDCFVAATKRASELGK